MEVKPGYKQTEVGVIPEDWDVGCVGDSFDVCNQLRLPISQSVRERMDGPYPYYGPTSVQGWINEYRVEGEYALIGEDGDHFLKWHDQPMTLLVRGKFNVNNHAHLVRGTKNLTEWFYWFFANRDITPHLTRQGAGRYKLAKAALLQIPCALPSAPEQHAIAGALSDVDALIGSLDQLIAKKRDLKQAVMQQLLTGLHRLSGFHGDWELKRFGKLFQLLQTANNPRADLSEVGDVAYIHYGDIHPMATAFLDCSTATLPFIAKAKVANTPLVEDGDLMMADASEDFEGLGKSVEIRNTNGREIVGGLHTFLLRGNRDLVADGFKGYLQFIPPTTELLRPCVEQDEERSSECLAHLGLAHACAPLGRHLEIAGCLPLDMRPYRNATASGKDLRFNLPISSGDRTPGSRRTSNFGKHFSVLALPLLERAPKRRKT